MNCRSVRGHLAAYADLTIEAPLKRAIAEHLRGCAACAAELAALDATVGLLAGLAPVASDPAVVAAVLSDLREAAAQGARAPTVRASRLLSPQARLAALAVGSLVVSLVPVLAMLSLLPMAGPLGAVAHALLAALMRAGEQATRAGIDVIAVVAPALWHGPLPGMLAVMLAADLALVGLIVAARQRSALARARAGLGLLLTF